MAKELTGRKVAAIFFGFFGLVFGANLIMMTFAAKTYDGVQEEDAYRKGRDYNDILAQARQQHDLGWQVAFDHEQLGSALEQKVTARFADKQGNPLDGLTVSALFFSQVEADHDERIGLAGLGDGRYEAWRDCPVPDGGNCACLPMAPGPRIISCAKTSSSSHDKHGVS
ncbi:RdxH [Iodidimonas gelatinilytica]|uniref:RdxH n=1 Tax=Iodidimonas gelatinilytica TaxID=1236966 RepID=A0A5A7MPV9_9PROT|nr:FixH family protein [Iodidimonas gelatinilytica]GEQ97886.1 RdxH [Iodidimonas gelatinilytica]